MLQREQSSLRVDTFESFPTRPFPRKRRRKPSLLQRLGPMILLVLIVAVGFWIWPKGQGIAWLSVPSSMAGVINYPRLHLKQDPLVLSLLPDKGEDKALRAQLEATIHQHGAPQLKTHLYYLNLKTGASVNLSGEVPVAAASVIKLPVLYEYFRALGEGKFSPLAAWRYDLYHQAGGSGEIGYKNPGFELQSYDLARDMIQLSDNTATNILIDRLGGVKELNERFRRMGLQSTWIENWLPDLEGTNKISPKDMALILYNIAYTKHLCASCQIGALHILEGTHNRRLIPAAMPPNTLVAHKTGDIGTSLGESALVMAEGKAPYLLAIQVERPYNHPQAKPLIIELSRTVFDAQR